MEIHHKAYCSIRKCTRSTLHPYGYFQAMQQLICTWTDHWSWRRPFVFWVYRERAIQEWSLVCDSFSRSVFLCLSSEIYHSCPFVIPSACTCTTFCFFSIACLNSCSPLLMLHIKDLNALKYSFFFFYVPLTVISFALLYHASNIYCKSVIIFPHYTFFSPHSSSKERVLCELHE